MEFSRLTVCRGEDIEQQAHKAKDELVDHVSAIAISRVSTNRQGKHRVESVSLTEPACGFSTIEVHYAYRLVANQATR
jgi:hypothetical protein